MTMTAYQQTNKIDLTPDQLCKLQELELKILLEFDRICRKHSIQYFLGGGTLLGAVRHGGFIPWDDDVDVMMLPEEYEKLRKVLPDELSDEYFYQTRETDPGYHSTFDKIRLKGTTFDTNFSRQYDLKCHGIFIDIFVHDRICKGCTQEKIHIYKTLFSRSLVKHKWGGTPMQFYGKFPLLCKFATVYKNHKDIRKLEKKEMKLITKYNRKDTGLLYDGRGEHTRHGSFAEDILLDGAVYIPFNGVDLPVPKRYDEYLKFSYGKDYMQLPPESERCPGHDLAVLDFGPYAN